MIIAGITDAQIPDSPKGALVIIDGYLSTSDDEVKLQIRHFP